MHRSFYIQRIPIPFELVLHFLNLRLGDGGFGKPEKSLDSLKTP